MNEYSVGTRHEISGWARWPRQICHTVAPDTPEAVRALLSKGPAIARGLGRSYGDSALSPELTIETRRLNRILEFRPEERVVVAEAGVSFSDLIEVFLPQGFFPMVTPGTKFVTIGGAIAADIHGKNHHRSGSFGDHVIWLDLLGNNGEIRRCSPVDNPELFNCTIGGMGLTGIVIRAAIRMMRIETGWIRQQTISVPSLGAAIDCFEDILDATYSVAWIDCLATGAAHGRSLVYLGEHARCDELPEDKARAPFAVRKRFQKRVFFEAPSWVLNRYSMRAHNHYFYRAGSRAPANQLVDFDTYFYPLDSILDWNRLYGRRGFVEYQCAIPLATARDAMTEMMTLTAQSDVGSFLSVTKRLGPGAPDRPLSFPIEGYTLSFDFPRTPVALSLMDKLDEVLLAAGGRLYLAKDSRMSRETFERSYRAGNTPFQRLIAPEVGKTIFGSVQSRRIGLFKA